MEFVPKRMFYSMIPFFLLFKTSQSKQEGECGGKKWYISIVALDHNRGNPHYLPKKKP
jgi:hypothetical protein